MEDTAKLCSHELKSLTECNDLREENNDSTIEAEDVQEAFDRLKKRTASAIGTPKVYLSL
jgi:FtsZ-binding cell division protein ZapB